METSVLKKMTRFVELSTKFSKQESDLFKKSNNGNLSLGYNSGTALINSTGSQNSWSPVATISVSGTFILNHKEIYVDGNGNVRARDNKPLTRGEQIEAEAKALAIMSDEFDEYNNLRVELSNYFSALNKINETE